MELSHLDFHSTGVRCREHSREGNGMIFELNRSRGWRPAVVLLAVGSFLVAGLSLASRKLAGQDLSAPEARGAAIWRTQCIGCHAEDGSGVQGKYEHRLSGPASLEELASLIEQTMPEADPEECIGEDARAVARFLLEGILAKAGEMQPVRRELQHLTAVQYAIAVAGLGDEFLGRGEPGGETGLSGQFYDGRNFDQKKRVAEQIDPRIDFDWQAGGPLGEKTGSEEFCVEWSGSFFAEETGEYEWVLRSPNGYRLYVNRQDEPLLDSWVATRDEPEKSARLRLVGGRWYPLRLQALKVKDPSFSIQLLWKRPRRLAELVPAGALRSEMVKPTLLVQTTLPEDDNSLGFERGTLFSPEWEEATTQAAWEVADLILSRLPAFVGSKPGSAEFASKCREFCARFATAAFRRPLNQAEQELYVEKMFAGRTEEEGVRICLLAILKSPWFHYLGLRQPVSAEQLMAEQIALAVTDDRSAILIRDQRDNSGFADRSQQDEWAGALLDSPAGRAKWREFFASWLNLEEAADISKDDETFAQFDEALLDDLQESALRFVEEVWQSPEADFRRLLLDSQLWMSPRMRAIYGPEAEPEEQPLEGVAEPFRKVEFSREERAGLLTHPLLLSHLAYFRSTSPIHRGVFVTREILGLALKPPPVAVEPIAEEAAAELTTRERVELQTRPENCMSCHQVINPLGFALEKYDAIGRFRLLDRGREVDTQVRLTLPERAEVAIRGARELAEFLVVQRETHRHFVRAVFQHAVRQPPEAFSPGLLDELTDQFVREQFNMRKLVVAIAVRSANNSEPAAGEHPQGGE